MRLREIAPTPREAAVLEYSWAFWGRPKQFAPTDEEWRVWLVLAGRGFGKTRTGAEWVRDEVQDHGARRLALVAPTAGDVRDVMVEGESGILAISPPWFKPRYEPSKRRLTWPNGAVATLFSAEKPARLRGPQYDRVWADELAAWKYPETWDQIMFGLRLRDGRGGRPKACVTTTPRPIPVIRRLLKARSSRITTGSTFENTGNLADEFLAEILELYEGTRLGRQELYAEILEDVPGALWKRTALDDLRVQEAPELVRIAVAIDPQAKKKQGADAGPGDGGAAKKVSETGIVVVGIAADGQGYVLEDLSGAYTPAEWGKVAVDAYHRWQADRIVAEVNQGGDMVEAIVREVDPRVAYTAVHASRGKRARAEPVSALYERRKVHHVGSMPLLEDQLCTWDSTTGEESPDRLDAMVWGLTFLMLDGAPPMKLLSPSLTANLPKRRL